jgi:hypothetical protein
MSSEKRRGARPEIDCREFWNVWRRGPRGRRWRFACAVVGGAFLAAQGGLAPAAHAGAPPGMVPYDHPVFKNGKRILWHGPWRSNGARAARESVRSAPAKAAVETKPTAQPQASRPFSILADPGDLCASRMAKDFASVLSDDGEAGRAIVGSTSPNGLAKVAKAGLADFAVVTLDSVVNSAEGDPEWVKRAPLVARLAPETLEVIAPREVKSIGDLQGRTVSFGDPDSATAISAKMLFSRLGIPVIPMYEPAPEGLDALAAGKREAVVVLGAKDLQALGDFGDGGRFHVVAIPWSTTLDSVYAPAQVTAADRPNLVAAHSAVDTVGEPMALIALDAPPGSQRADMLGRVARAFFDNYDALLSDNHDAHWREVNLAAEASWPRAPWARLAAAQSWLDTKKTSPDSSLQAFRASAKTVADSTGGPTANDSDRLYESLTRWRGPVQ